MLTPAGRCRCVRRVVRRNEHTVFPSVRGETAQAVGEEQIRRQTDRLIVPLDAIVATDSGPGSGCRHSVRSSWLASEPRSPDQHDARGRLEQDLFVLLHHGRFQHEDAARLVDPLGPAVGPDDAQKLLLQLFLVAARLLAQENQVDLEPLGAEVGLRGEQLSSQAELVGAFETGPGRSADRPRCRTATEPSCPSRLAASTERSARSADPAKITCEARR